MTYPKNSNVVIDTTVVYDVVSNTDTTEGRGVSVIVGTFTTKAQADAYSKGRGVMGSDAVVKNRSCQVVVCPDGTSYLLGKALNPKDPEQAERERKALVASALQKLTWQERQALRLKNL